jgi:hypothetical protein
MSKHTTIAPQEAADRLAIRDLVEAYAHCADRMGRVDRRQILATPRDPVGEFLVLIECDCRVHQHRIALARNKR